MKRFILPLLMLGMGILWMVAVHPAASSAWCVGAILLCEMRFPDKG